MLEGNRVYLDTIERSDLQMLRAWRNRPDFRKFFREYKEINADMQTKWYEDKVINDNSTLMFSIRDIACGELIGCCGLCYINWVHRHSDLSLYIGKDHVYIDDEGLAQEACQLLFHYGFQELALHKIWTEIYDFDKKKLDLYSRLGFKQDGMLRDQYFYDGKWHDSRMMSLLKGDWDRCDEQIKYGFLQNKNMERI